MKITMIGAVADNGVIGYKNKIPWTIKEDLTHFKSVTGNSPLIMGRKTFESLPKILPGRIHLVLSNEEHEDSENVFWYTSIEDLITKNIHHEEVFVIGGSNIYSMFEGISNKLIMTEVHCLPVGDTLFPELKWRWIETSRESPEVSGTVPISIVTLNRGKTFELSIST